MRPLRSKGSVASQITTAPTNSGNAAQGEVGPEERGEDGAHRGRSALLRRAGHDAADLSTGGSATPGGSRRISVRLPRGSGRPRLARNEVFGTSNRIAEGLNLSARKARDVSAAASAGPQSSGVARSTRPLGLT